jgi:hypothetical protein
MTRLNRRALIGAVGALAAFVWPVLAQGPSGSYTAQGRNPDGSSYKGTVQLTQSANVISMAWQVGASSYIGTGSRNGRVVIVNWGDATPVVYVVMPDGTLHSTLHSTWAGGLALEKLTPNQAWISTAVLPT